MPVPAAVLSVLVTANTGGAAASLTRLDRRLKGTAKTSDATSARITKGMKIAGLGIAAAAGGSVFAAAKFESAFAEVRKTVDTTEKGFGRIEKGLRKLSKEIPASSAELSELAGEAGALGVKSRDIVKFTKTAAQLGTTTNLSAEEAANALARLGNIMDSKSSKAFERMGATLVDLGNKGASTEDEIAEMALRIAGAGKTIGLAESDVLGLAASLANVGIKAQAGGSSVSRVMLEMQDAIARGGGDLRAFADIAGSTVADFKMQFERDAPAAIAAFASGLGDINKEGGSTIETLKGVNLNEIRVRDTLLRIAGNTKNFTDAQKISNAAWKDNNALAKEAKERYKTFESQLVLLKNTVVDAGINIGQQLLPDLKEMVSILRDPKLTLDEKLSALGDKIGDIVEKWAPKVAKAAVSVGKAFATSLFETFRDANPLGKLLIGAGLIRLVGGKGALVGSGAALGRFLGIGVAAGTASTVAGGAAGAGAAGGIGGAIGGVLKNVKWARVGVAGAGIAVASTLMDHFELQARKDSEDVFERVFARISEMQGGFIKQFLDTSGQASAGNELDEIADRLKRIVESGNQLDVGKFRQFRSFIEDTQMSPTLRSDLLKLLELAGGPMAEKLDLRSREIHKSFKHAFKLEDIAREHKSNLVTIRANFGKNSEETKALSRENNRALAQHVADMIRDQEISFDKGKRILGRFGLSVSDLPPEFRVMSSIARTAFNKVKTDAEKLKDKTGRDFGDMSSDAHAAFRRMSDDGRGKSKELKTGVVGTVNSMVGAVGRGYERLRTDTNSALRGLGAKPVNFAIVGGRKVGTSGLQRGGPIDAGAPSGDSVPAMLERGEFVLNRKAVAALGEDKLNAINFGMAPRFQVGGLAGGISKLATSVSKKFGLAITSGLRPGDPGHHGQGLAADVAGPVANMNRASSFINSSGIWRRLLEGIYSGSPNLSVQSGQRVPPSFWGPGTWAAHGDHLHLALSGAFGPAAQQIARVMLKGPDGPLKDMGQAALDKVRKGANRFLGKQSAMGLSSEGGGMSKGQIASVWRRANDFGDPGLMAAIALAESSGSPGAVGHDPGGTQGLGLWQITTGFNDDLIAKYGGRTGMFNPINNAKAAGDILQRQGLGAWVVYNTGAYRQFLQNGGIVGMQRGGRPKRGNKTKSTKFSRAAFLLDKAQAMQKRLRKLNRRIGLSDERLQIAVAEHGADTSEAGADLSTSERNKQIKLNERLLKQLTAGQGFATKGLNVADVGFGLTRGKKRGTFRDLKRSFREMLTGFQGVTGRGGRIFDVAQGLNVLRNPVVDPADPKLSGSPLALKNQLAHVEGLIAKREESISIARTLSQLESSPAGTDFSRGERSTLITATKNLLQRLRLGRDIAKKGFFAAHAKAKSTRGDERDLYSTLRGDFKTAVEKFQGVTGRGGTIFDAKIDLQELLGGKAADTRRRLSISDLLSFAEAVRFGAFDRQLPPFGGSFAQGGVVPGPVGSPRTVIAHGGETVSRPGDMVIFTDLYIGGEKIAENVRHEIRKRENESNRRMRVGAIA